MMAAAISAAAIFDGSYLMYQRGRSAPAFSHHTVALPAIPLAKNVQFFFVHRHGFEKKLLFLPGSILPGFGGAIHKKDNVKINIFFQLAIFLLTIR